MVSREQMRKLINKYLCSDADFNAFVIDNYSDFYKVLSDSMDRTTKVNKLFEHITDLDLMASLLINYCSSPESNAETARKIDGITSYTINPIFNTGAHSDAIFMPTRQSLLNRSQKCLEISRCDFMHQLKVPLLFRRVPELVQPQNRSHGEIYGFEQEGEDLPNEELIDYLIHIERLLLVGMPGSGKTQTLRLLCEQLLVKAKVNPELPVPFLLNLSTFSGYQGPFRDWLAVGLTECAAIPSQIGKELLQQGRLFFLLDGFDEMASERQALALMEINNLIRIADPSMARCVVCSRTAEYVAANIPLILPAALEVRPLSASQVHHAVAQSDSSSVALRTAIERDETFTTLLQTPLLLTIAMRALEESPTPSLTGKQPEEIQSLLYDAYIVHMLRRTGAISKFSAKLTIIWLRWLAQYLCRERSSLFLIERLQPAALTSTRAYRIAFRFTLGLAFASFFGLPFGLFGSPYFGFVNGGFVGLIAVLNGSLLRRLLNGGLLGSIFTAIGVGGYYRLIETPFGACFYALLGLPLGALLAVILSRPYEERIIPVEHLRWSWSQAKSRWKFHSGYSSMSGLLASILPGFFWFCIVSIFSVLSRGCARLYAPLQSSNSRLDIDTEVILSTLAVILIIAFSVGSLTWLARFIVAGWVKTMHEQSLQPNEGIRNSMVNGLREGVLPGCLVGMLLGMGFNLLVGGQIIASLILGFVVGAWTWLSIGLRGGLGEIVKHAILRLFLCWETKLPLALVPWLEACRACLLLRRQGGAYLFWHETLQTYFANMEDCHLSILAERIQKPRTYLQSY